MSRKPPQAEKAPAKKKAPERPQRALSSAERKKLRGLAHALKPLVTVGRGGLSAGALREIDLALTHHELVKVRLAAERDERAALAEAIAAKLRCGVAGTIGQVAILYRQDPDPEERRVELGADLYAASGEAG